MLRILPSSPNMQRAVIFLAIALLLGGANYFLSPWQSDVAQDHTPTLVVQDQELELEHVGLEGNPSALPEGEAALKRTALEAEKPPSSVEFKTGDDSILISVVDRNAQPLAGAQVSVIDRGVNAAPEMLISHARRYGLEGAFFTFGKEYRANATGQVRIPKPVGKYALAGSTLNHFTTTEDLSVVKGRATFILDLVESVPVQVVRQDGTPVEDAEVYLSQKGKLLLDGMVKTRTNEEGMGSLKLSFSLRSELSKKRVTVVGLNVHHHEPIETVVDMDNLPEEPLVLIMPATGSVEVVLLDLNNKPVGDNFLVLLSALTKRHDGVADWTVSPQQLTAQTKQGKVVFPHVAIGQLLRIQARYPDFNEFSQNDVYGPKRSNEWAYLTLQENPQFPTLVGRILNTEDKVAKNITFETRLRHHYDGQLRSSRGEKFRTDAEGFFRWQLTRPFKAGTVRTFTIIMRPTKRKASRSVAVDLSYALEPGDNSLGDLVVDVPPVLVKGIVLGSDGKAVNNAIIAVQRETAIRNSLHRTYWDSVKHWGAIVDKGGNFEIRGHPEDGKFRLFALEANHANTTQEVQLGDMDVELVLKKSIHVSGRILLDSEINPKSLHIRLHRPSLSDAEDDYNQSVNIGSNGKFSFGKQPEAYATILVRSAAFRENLLIQENILLHSKGDSMVLPDIDLRGMLTSSTITVVDENGAILDAAWVRIPGNRFSTSTNGRPLTIVRKGGSFTIDVGEENRRSVHLEDVKGNQEVVLSEGGLQVNISLENAHIIPQGWTVYGSVLYLLENGETDSTRSQILHFDANYSSNATLPLPGKYSVRFSIVHSGTSVASKMHDVGNGDSYASFHALDLTTTQAFSVSLDPQDLDDSIAETLVWESEQ